MPDLGGPHFISEYTNDNLLAAENGEKSRPGIHNDGRLWMVEDKKRRYNEFGGASVLTRLLLATCGAQNVAELMPERRRRQQPPLQS